MLPSSGAYSWIVSSPPTAFARMRIRWAGDQSVADIGNVDFRISL
jgi:hypothetical protein